MTTATLSPGLLSSAPCNTITAEPTKAASTSTAPSGMSALTIAKRILSAISIDELPAVMFKSALEWSQIKTGIVSRLFSKKRPTLRSYLAAANLSLASLEDRLTERKKQELDGEAELAVFMALENLTHTNQLYIDWLEALGKTPGACKPFSEPAYLRYQNLVPQNEMVLCAISAYISGRAKPKKAGFADEVAYFLKKLANELSVAGMEFGLGKIPELSGDLVDQTAQALPKEDANFEEMAWGDANKHLKAQESGA